MKNISFLKERAKGKRRRFILKITGFIVKK